VPLETATYVSDLVLNNPAGSDPLAKSADHIRLIKAVLKATLGQSGPLVNASGQLVLGDGTASLPSYTFGSEATTGFYRIGSGKIGIAGSIVGQGVVPIGGRVDWFGPDSTIPAWLMPVDGQTLSKTTYPELFAAIGYTWGGSGDSFMLPPGKNRFFRHRDNTAGSAAGPVGTLQTDDVHPHTHGVAGTTNIENTSHTHGFSGTTGSMNQNNPHYHTETGFSASYPGYGQGQGVGGGGSFGFATNSNTGATNIDHNHNFSGTTGGENQNHAHTFSVTSGSYGTSETRPLSATVIVCIRVL
jgi:microcystin-dependent protein